MFTDFAASDDTIFTRGDADTVRFADRPMWLSVDTSGDGITLTAEDATNEGQPIQLDAGWLAGHGIDDHPIAYYTDGTPIPVSPSADGSTYVVDAPHFTKIEVTDPDLSTSWKEEGHTRQFLADGPDATDEFNITVSNVTVDIIEFRYWSAQNASSGHVFDGDEPFEKEGRESLERPGYYTLNYINETDLATGDAMLADSQFELVEINLMLDTYDFSDGNMTYRFDQDHGYLEEVVEDGTGASITMQNVRNWGEEPTEPVNGPGVADIGKYIMEAVYDDFNDPPYEDWRNLVAWSGDPDEEVQGNILWHTTTIDVKLEYSLTSQIYTYHPDDTDNADCFERDECHVRAMIQGPDFPMNFHVHETEYDPDANHNAYVANPEEIRTNCSGDSCFWDDNCHCWDWFLGGEVVLEAEYNHGFLDSTTEPFWVCGEVTVWESTDASDDSAIILEDILCKTDLVTDPADASDPSGYITVYTDLRDV